MFYLETLVVMVLTLNFLTTELQTLSSLYHLLLLLFILMSATIIHLLLAFVQLLAFLFYFSLEVTFYLN